MPEWIPNTYFSKLLDIERKDSFVAKICASIKTVLNAGGLSRWEFMQLFLPTIMAVVLCGGILLDSLHVVSIYATPGQLLMQAAAGVAPAGSDGETPYYAIDADGVMLYGDDGLPASTNNGESVIKGVWKGGLAKSSHTHGGVHIEDNDPDTFYLPFRDASILIDTEKMVFLKAAQFEWGDGAYEGGKRVFQWASTPEINSDAKPAEELREAGDITGLQWRREGSGVTEDVDEQTAKTNEANAKLHSENAIVFTGSLEAKALRIFGSINNEEDGYVVRVRYPDAAKLPNGERGDLLLTYRSISLFSTAAFNSDKEGYAALGIIRARNLIGEARYGVVDSDAPNSTDGDNWVWFVGNNPLDDADDAVGEESGFLGNNAPISIDIGLRVTCELSVVRSGGSADKPNDRIKGTVRFAMSDLDGLSRLALETNNIPDTYGHMKQIAAIDTYTESVLVLDGAKSYALVPDGNFLRFAGQGDAGTANGVRFIASASDDDTFDSGFAVLADAEGFVFEWTAYGGTSSASTSYRLL